VLSLLRTPQLSDASTQVAPSGQAHWVELAGQVDHWVGLAGQVETAHQCDCRVVMTVQVCSWVELVGQWVEMVAWQVETAVLLVGLEGQWVGMAGQTDHLVALACQEHLFWLAVEVDH
jgi:hypothetical protein